MPYTKSGISYTAKPTTVRASPYQRSVAARYARGPTRPSFPRSSKPVFVMRTPGAKAAGETKYFDSQRSATAVPASTGWLATEIDPATLNTLVCPTQGAQINNRIGRKIILKKLRIRGVITPTVQSDAADVTVPRSYRIIVFQDQQTNGAQAQGEDVMKAPTTATAPLAFSSFQSLANFGRFRVLKDKIYSDRNAVAFNDAAATGSMVAGQNIPFKINLKFARGIPIHFNSSNGGVGDGDVGDIVDNSFHVLMQANSTSGASTVQYQCRAVYTDS